MGVATDLPRPLQGGDKLREGIEPEEKPVEVPTPVRVGVHYAHKVSGKDNYKFHCTFV